MRDGRRRDDRGQDEREQEAAAGSHPAILFAPSNPRSRPHGQPFGQVCADCYAPCSSSQQRFAFDTGARSG